MKLYLLSFLISTFSCGIILKSHEGFEIANSDSKIQFDVFYDLHCSESMDFYKIMYDILETKINDQTI